MAQRTRRPRPSVLLLVVLLAALAVGASVSLLVSARSAGPPPPVGPSTELYLPPWVLSAVIFGFGLALILPVAYFALRSPKGPGIDTRYIVGALSLLLAIIVAIALLHLGGGGGNTGLGVGPVMNTTAHNNTTAPPKNTSSSSGGGVLSNFNFHVPPWLLFALVVVALVGVAAAAVPSLSEYLADRRESRNLRFRAENVKAAVQSALRDAARDLGSSLDPRALILALYATLLARIEPLTKDLDRATAEEIRRLHLTRLGIRPSAAEDLTRVFEEARYSSHPLGPAEVARATRAIRTAEQDLETSRSIP
jgi:type II secretory pathway pseudopilin PulG